MWLIDGIKNFFNSALGLFKKFLDQALPPARQIIVGQLHNFALQAIAEVSVLTLTNDEKRNEAFGRIKSYALTNGIMARDSLINLVIEMAVLSLKKD